MKSIKRQLKYIWLLPMLVACFPQGSGVMHTAYHNTTAHYNAFFYADERIKEVEQRIYSQYDWNYNKVLPIFAQYDTTTSQSFTDLTEDIIKKASIAIQRHPGSRWEDMSYVMVGKARMYGSEFPDAIETFKYVNKKGEDDDARHEALINLIRTFVEANEISNAIAVSDYLKKEKLNEKNKYNLHLHRAYLFQKRDDLNQMVQNLAQAAEIMPMFVQDKARIHFILGQVYQDLGFEAQAFEHYERALHSGPTYELSFYTKLNMAQVTELAKGNDVKRVRKYFKKLLRDPKNLEYQDKIYYEMATFELKNGDMDEAIALFKMSIRKSVKNDRQKSHSYLALAELYYDSIKNFPLAKQYYDSTVTVLPKDEDNYAQIVNRQEVLSEFVEHITTVHKNDSLIALSSLPEDSLKSLATAIVKQRIENEKARRKREKEKQRQAELNRAFDDGGDLISAGLQAGDTWYFYNSTVLSRGASEFRRVWGNRPLEDNWRRSNKAAAIQDTEGEEGLAQKKEETEEDLDATLDAEVEKLLAEVPGSQAQIDKLLAEVETALYHLGNIYNFKLEEKENAISSFEQLLSRFHDTEYRPEVLYQLFLLYDQLGQPDFADEKANELKSTFPESVYAKLIDNPNYREESDAATEQLQKVYRRAYNLYAAENFKDAKFLIDSALTAHPENPFSDNLALLDAIVTGELEGLYKYQFALNNFMKNYPESDMSEYAAKLLKTSEDYQVNIYSSSKARFIEYFDQMHYLVVAYPNKADLAKEITKNMDEFIGENGYPYSSGNLILNEEYSLILINEIPDRFTATEVLRDLETFDIQNMHKGEKIYTFIITKDNFDIFYQTKDLNAYLNFFDRKYQ